MPKLTSERDQNNQAAKTHSFILEWGQRRLHAHGWGLALVPVVVIGVIIVVVVTAMTA
jgi:hypothetical protein